MDPLASVLCIQNPSGIPFDLRPFFSEPGRERPERIPCNDGNSKPLLCFLRYSSEAAARSAQRAVLVPPGIIVSSISNSPKLIAEYHLANTSWSRRPPNAPSQVGSPHSLAYPCSVETSIPLNLHGNAITYDLSGLEDDATAITELMRISRSEAHIWLTVAAHYRRTGRPVQAERVASALLKEHHVTIANHGRRPVQLLLAACAIDLARRAKDEHNPALATFHEGRAIQHLQEVYGEDTPAVRPSPVIVPRREPEPKIRPKYASQEVAFQRALVDRYGRRR
ncbi:hypothetical protein BKA70DRAFT_648046 [Coprinopsis sp. MPI-PUGE-AT-0042]|nr:hypothetical protein BKA70DRAFT_648046 [Coprinopsis sp. MPI-PUGE-AT-0042]